MQDLAATRVVFASPAALWQIPLDVYAAMEVTLAELARRVRPCGRAGAYLYRQLEDYNRDVFVPGNRLHRGENWTLGDQPAVGVLLRDGGAHSVRGGTSGKTVRVMMPSFSMARRLSVSTFSLMPGMARRSSPATVNCPGCSAKPQKASPR